jgi:hypothetical protein
MPGLPTDKRAAAAASVWSRQNGAAEIIEQIADILVENPLHEKLRPVDFAAT